MRSNNMLTPTIIERVFCEDSFDQAFDIDICKLLEGEDPFIDMREIAHQSKLTGKERLDQLVAWHSNR